MNDDLRNDLIRRNSLSIATVDVSAFPGDITSSVSICLAY